ncbi:MAG: FixH family protein [Flavobacteriaceae bacterium]
MKINWGTGLVIGMITFMSFILVMVIMMMTDKKYDHDLVVENYYAKDLAYQTEIDAEKNTNTLSAPITIEKSSEGLVLHFPEELNGKALNGTVQMYRPSNQQLDFQLPLEVRDSQMSIPASTLVEGQWKITLDWTMDGKRYMFKKEFSY